MKRIITSLVIDKGKCIKPYKFANPVYLGDPVNIVRILNDQGCGEITLFDKSGEIDFNLLKRISRMSLVPIAYGGKYNEFDEIKKLFKIGFEKVIFSSSILYSQDLINKTIKNYGASSVVLILNYKIINNEHKWVINHGTNLQDIDFGDLVEICININPSEIILQNTDKESSFEGIDTSVLKYFTKSNIPLVLSGGCKSKSEIINLINHFSISGVAVGSLFSLFGTYKTPLTNHQFNIWDLDGAM
jgi:cyclase